MRRLKCFSSVCWMGCVAAAGCMAPVTPGSADIADTAVADSQIAVDTGVADAEDASDSAVVDRALDVTPSCNFPLSSLLAQVATTVAQAKTAAEAYCTGVPTAAGYVNCADGGIAIVAGTAFGDLTWWFAADGTLLGFRSMSDTSTGGCFAQMYGTIGACPPGPWQDPGLIGLCSSAPDVIDTGDAP